MKDSGLRIRVERQLREKFLELCREQDRPASQVLREFMRQYIEQHERLADNEKQQRAKP
jgi:predicted DNA-binding protein